MKSIAVIISPNWQDYAKKYLADFLSGLENQDYPGVTKIFITDNESSESSYDFLHLAMPAAEIHRNQGNDGYAKGCNDSIKRALAQGFDYIAIFNIHTVLESDCLTQLIKTAESDPQIGAVQGRMMLWPEKDKISSLGNQTHFLGFGYCDQYQQKYNHQDKQLKDIFYPSGSCFFVKAEVLNKIGLFEEEYWMYNEDQELGWRIWLAGYRCVLAPEAVLYNKYEFQRSIKKFYWMDRNRILAILKSYRWPTLFLILPPFIIMETGLILFSLKTGWFKEKIRTWKYFLKLKNWRYIFQARKQNQELRVLKDKDLKHLISGKIWYQEVDDWKLRLVNPFFNTYWRLARLVIFW